MPSEGFCDNKDKEKPLIKKSQTWESQVSSLAEEKLKDLILIKINVHNMSLGHMLQYWGDNPWTKWEKCCKCREKGHFKGEWIIFQKEQEVIPS